MLQAVSKSFSALAALRALSGAAESSVTLDGIVYVVDCGLAKLRALDPRSGVARLAAAPISRAAAAQRAGRAGRTRPGKCFRLYTRAAFDAAMPAPTPPEIARADLAPVLLQLKALGIDDLVRGFDFLTPPPAPLVARALELLFALGALDAHARLTRPLGLRMAELALDPMLAKVLLSAQRFGCTDEALAIAAMTSTVQSGGGDAAGSVWVRQDGGGKAQRESTRRAFAAEEGDHLTYLNVFVAFTTAPSARKAPAQWCHAHGLDYKFLCRAVSVRNQLRRYLERVGAVSAVTGRTETETLGRRGAASATAESVQRCLTTGLFAHAARMQPDGTFRPVARAGSPGGGGEVTLHAHPSSLMFNRKADWVVFGEAVQTAGKTFIRDITKVDKAWLLEYAPSYFESREGGDRVSRG
ncbi:hypothetical protein KEM52_000498 [Ascosphaera acerosa]|nr:hypothetical protein KEM52_000498 [Ascosphaera acerosa]